MTPANTRMVVVDDTDPEIQYSGAGWFQDQGSQDEVGNFGPAYQHTLHGTSVPGTFSYLFHGTFVEVFGTNNIEKANETLIRPWECFLDGIKINSSEPFSPLENNWSLCKSDYNLVNKLHNITVLVNTPRAAHPFWFDYIRYIPSPYELSKAGTVLVDNDDPGIVYDSGWGSLGQTANMTQKNGSIVTFNFTGIQLSWIGFIPKELPHEGTFATYFIDGGPKTNFRLNGLAPNDAITVYNQIFFTTAKLTAGPHSLTVMHLGDTSHTPLSLDYLLIANNSMSQTTSISFSIPSSTHLPRPQPSRSGATPRTEAIIGGIIGTVSLIFLSFIGILWLRKLQRPPPSSHNNQVTHNNIIPSGSPPNINHSVSGGVSTSLSGMSSYDVLPKYISEMRRNYGIKI